MTRSQFAEVFGKLCQRGPVREQERFCSVVEQRHHMWRLRPICFQGVHIELSDDFERAGRVANVLAERAERGRKDQKVLASPLCMQSGSADRLSRPLSGRHEGTGFHPAQRDTLFCRVDVRIGRAAEAVQVRNILSDKLTTGANALPTQKSVATNV